MMNAVNTVYVPAIVTLVHQFLVVFVNVAYSKIRYSKCMNIHIPPLSHL